MRHRSVQSRAGIMTAAAVMAIGLGATAAQATFVLDLKLSGGGTATTVAAGASVTLDVWGTVTSGTTNAAAEGIQDVFFGILNSGNVGTILPVPSSTPQVGVALQSPFTGVATDVTPNPTTSYGGTLYGPDVNHQSVGSTVSASADNWVFARSTSMTTVTDGQATKIGTLTFKVDPAATPGSTGTLTLNGRTASSLVIPALWQEDGVAKDNGVGGGGTFTLGSSVSISVANNVWLTGDYNEDGFVGGADLNIVLSFWGQNVTPNNHAQGDGNGDGFVGGADLNLTLGNWGASAAEPSIAAVPEPASLGLLGLVGAGLVARRRRA